MIYHKWFSLEKIVTNKENAQGPIKLMQYTP